MLPGFPGSREVFSLVEASLGILKKNGSDSHYLFLGRVTTVVGILVSIGTACLTVIFLLGMPWKRTTSHGFFWGLGTAIVSWNKPKPESDLAGLAYCFGKNERDYLSHKYEDKWYIRPCVVALTVLLTGFFKITFGSRSHMWMKWMRDLRFVIGLFFGIISGILFFSGSAYPVELNINLFGSVFLAVFSFFMLGLGVWYSE